MEIPSWNVCMYAYVYTYTCIYIYTHTWWEDQKKLKIWITNRRSRKQMKLCLNFYVIPNPRVRQEWQLKNNRLEWQRDEEECQNPIWGKNALSLGQSSLHVWLHISAQIGRNPGLQDIWEDEKQRRRQKCESSQIKPPESQGKKKKNCAAVNPKLWMRSKQEDRI